MPPGLGRELVDAAIAWATARGADHLRLWVDDTNPAAAEFYRALGFVPTGESQPVSESSSDRQSCFERRLASASQADICDGSLRRGGPSRR